jgi:hypothetical protein
VTAVYAIVIALSLIVIFMAMLVVGLLRSHAAILRKLESLGAGLDDDHRGTLAISERPPSAQPANARSIVGVDPDGDPVAISLTVGDEPVLIAFLSTSCSSCTVFWERLDRAEMVFGDRPHRVVIATLGPDEESPTRAKALQRGDADVVMSSQAWESYEVPGAPYFVIADPKEGVLGEGSAETFDALAQFLEDSTNDLAWDRRRARDSSGADREDRIDRELRQAGIRPDDPRLHHQPGEIDGS